MNFRLLRLSPLIVAFLVGAVLMALDFASTKAHSVVFGFLETIERATFDQRAKWAWFFRQPVSDKLGIVYVNEKTLDEMQRKLKMRWPLPRWVHGVALRELTQEEVAGVGYDIFFTGRHEQEVVTSPKGKRVLSDEFFAQEIMSNGKVILGAPNEGLVSATALKMPDPLFAKAAAGVGHALRHTDSDGVFRRVLPFVDDKDHHRTWQLGLRLAANTMGLDLDRATVDPWFIRVPGSDGRVHEIPLDGEGRMVVRWSIDPDHPRKPLRGEFSQIIAAAYYRTSHDGLPSEPWKGRTVLIGSTGQNPPIADQGGTPIGNFTPYLFVHCNVANSLLTGTYVHVPRLWMRMAIIGVMVALVCLISWRLRVLWATVALVQLVLAYLVLTVVAYGMAGWWLPVAFPVLGSVCVTHSVMVVFRFFFERSHRSRMRGIFASILSPDALELLLQQPQASWASEEKRMTVFFADIRGFTALTDGAAPVGDEGRESGGAAAAPVPTDRDNLETVNLYLSAVVDALKKHRATLDKYMGDSVMAFWGAPLDHPGHAAAAVRAAIAGQRAIRDINARRERENEALRQEGGGGAGRAPLKCLQLGMGINTGTMTVGFMGADSHLSNYTVFGREVNIASRLEGVSGAGRIFITEETRKAAILEDPKLEDRIKPAGSLNLKGIAEPVPAFEVDWKTGDE